MKKLDFAYFHLQIIGIFILFVFIETMIKMWL